jgi:hypothetical protein
MQIVLSSRLGPDSHQDDDWWMMVSALIFIRVTFRVHQAGSVLLSLVSSVSHRSDVNQSLKKYFFSQDLKRGSRKKILSADKSMISLFINILFIFTTLAEVPS